MSPNNTPKTTNVNFSPMIMKGANTASKKFINKLYLMGIKLQMNKMIKNVIITDISFPSFIHKTLHSSIILDTKVTSFPEFCNYILQVL
jgi:hypothetical protein